MTKSSSVVVLCTMALTMLLMTTEITVAREAAEPIEIADITEQVGSSQQHHRQLAKKNKKKGKGKGKGKKKSPQKKARPLRRPFQRRNNNRATTTLAAPLDSPPSDADLMTLSISEFQAACPAVIENWNVRTTPLTRLERLFGTSDITLDASIENQQACLGGTEKVNMVLKTSNSATLGMIQLNACDGTTVNVVCGEPCTTTAGCEAGTVCVPSVDILGYSSCVATPELGASCSGDFTSDSDKYTGLDVANGTVTMCDQRESICIKDVEQSTTAVDGGARYEMAFAISMVPDGNGGYTEVLPPTVFNHDPAIEGTCEQRCETDEDCPNDKQWCKETDKSTGSRHETYSVCAPYPKTGE
mmetsp:Transcript_2726/g.7584  ORF Transcript_2726/g.7584 Transcript_2726/m.7584 type:complete len:358 (-) Transcript_2726:435-1508(-)